MCAGNGKGDLSEGRDSRGGEGGGGGGKERV